ncbi:MAG TPA: SMP-30/gluconolactonase/LRE family protein [Paludibaculum sp.]|jgi:gluconolactonase
MVRICVLALIAAVAAAQDFSQVKIERAGAGYRFTEGPAWSHEGYLLFSDIPNDRLHKLVPGKGVELVREGTGGGNGNAIDDKGRVITCEGDSRRVTRRNAKGEVEVLAERFEGKRLNAPNDVVVRKDGNIYFTDPAFGKQDDTKELPFYGVFRITSKGELSVIARSDKRPNGIALSPNGRLLYVAGSDERVIRVYDLDRSGTASNERVLITGIDGVPDGLKTDEKGNIYVACRGVAIYSPGGQFIHMIELAEKPSNLVFGDGDLQGLYMTTRGVLLHIRLDVKGWSSTQ